MFLQYTNTNLDPASNHNKEWHEAKYCECIRNNRWWSFFWLPKCVLNFRFDTLNDASTKSVNIRLCI